MTYSNKQQENHIKLDLLKSLARSQRALAVMMEELAELTSGSHPGEESLQGHSLLSPHRIAEHLAVLAKHQVILTERITGMKLARIVKGRPGRPWLHRRVLAPSRRGR